MATSSHRRQGLSLWERRLHVVEKAAKIQAEDFEGQFSENSQRIHDLKRDILELQEKIKFVKALEGQKVLQPDISEIKSKRINATNIQSAIEYQKQKCFELVKEINLLRHDYIIKQNQLIQKKKQWKQLKKICYSTQKSYGYTIRNNTKRARDLENKLAAIEMKQDEALYVSKKYEEIISILEEDASHYEEQLNEMRNKIKEQEVDLEYGKQDKELALFTKHTQQKELNQTQKKFIEAAHKKQKKLAKCKKKLSKLENKEKKYQEDTRKKLSGIHDQARKRLHEKEENELNKYKQLFLQISEATGITSFGELEDRIKNQQATHSNLKALCKSTGTELKQKEKELEELFEKETVIEKPNVDRNIAAVIVEMEEALKEKETDNSLKEAELNKFSLMLSEARMSLERILTLLDISLGQKTLHNISDFPMKNIIQMCEDNMEVLLQSFGKLHINGVKKPPLPFIHPKHIVVANPEIKKKQDLLGLETSSEDDENNRLMIKQRSQKFVEAHTKNRSNRRQILRL